MSIARRWIKLLKSVQTSNFATEWNWTELKHPLRANGRSRHGAAPACVVAIIIIIIIINRFVWRRKVVTSEALGPGSVLVSRERRESLREEECHVFSLSLKTATESLLRTVCGSETAGAESIEKRVVAIMHCRTWWSSVRRQPTRTPADKMLINCRRALRCRTPAWPMSISNVRTRFIRRTKRCAVVCRSGSTRTDSSCLIAATSASLQFVSLSLSLSARPATRWRNELLSYTAMFSRSNTRGEMTSQNLR